MEDSLSSWLYQPTPSMSPSHQELFRCTVVVQSAGTYVLLLFALLLSSIKALSKQQNIYTYRPSEGDAMLWDGHLSGGETRSVFFSAWYRRSRSPPMVCASIPGFWIRHGRPCFFALAAERALECRLILPGVAGCWPTGACRITHARSSGES